MDMPFPAAPPRPDLALRAVALRRSLEVARVLMRSRVVDLTGVEDAVGHLCASLLEQPAQEAAALRRELSALLVVVDAMLASESLIQAEELS